MANHCLLLTVTAVAAVLLLAATSGAQPAITAYTMLEQYGFPPGIIPQGVQSYERQEDGSVEVQFSGDCGLRVGGFSLRYSSRLTGNIQNGSISGLEGVKVKVVIPWVGIREVSRDGDQITVHAGAVSKSFPVGNFAVKVLNNPL